MRNINTEYSIYIAILLGLGLYSCDSILNPEPIGQLALDNFYNNSDDAITGINAAYDPLAHAYNGPMYLMGDLASDDAFSYRIPEPGLFETDQNDGIVANMWDIQFNGIARSNTALAKISNLEFPSDQASLKESLLGQALFLRAFYYFNLVRFFGDVPLFTEPLNSPEEASISRTPVEEVYEQIEMDLLEAANKLPEKSALDGTTGWEVGRATSNAAKALLSKVHLTIENWGEAAQLSKEVIDSEEYDLFSNYGDNFQGKNENGIESIFEVQYSSQDNSTGAGHNTTFGHPELVNGNGQEMLVPTDDTIDVNARGVNGNGIVQDFESEERRDASISTYGSITPIQSNEPYNLVNKYYVGDAAPAGNSSVNYPVFRYSEVLLIRAEALNELGSSGPASVLVNQVRDRVGLDRLSGNAIMDQNLLRKNIWKERRVELSFESKRFFDLNRTGRLKERMAGQDINVDPDKITPHPITDKPQYLYAIPNSEITTNANTTQNPGY